jgi:two-component system, chemotaxis family, chemotaxis protein CheY
VSLRPPEQQRHTNCSLFFREAQDVPRVLVAEDSFALANLLEFVLKRSGFNVCLARHGNDAALRAEEEIFDLIVLDQQMPGMTGTEVLQKIRSGGLNQQTTTYLCTAKTHELDVERLRTELQIAGVFHKPFSPRVLVDTLLGPEVNAGAN